MVLLILSIVGDVVRIKYLIIGLTVSLLSLYYSFNNVSFDELINAFNSVNYIYLLPALFWFALSFLFRALRWRYIISSIKEVKTTRLFSPLMLGFMGNLLPARAGEFIRAYLLGKKERISFGTSLATIFIERLLDMFMLLLLLAWILLFKTDIFVHGDTGLNHKLMGYMIKFGWISLIVCLIIFFFSAFLQYKNENATKLINLIIKPLPSKWSEKIHEWANSFSKGLNILRDKKGFSYSVLLSILVSFTAIITFYPLYQAFGIESLLPTVTSLIVLIITIDIFIVLFPTPGFIGSFQAGCVVALHEIFNVPKAIALSYGIVAWLLSIGFIICVGLIFIIRDNISFSDFFSKKT